MIHLRQLYKISQSLVVTIPKQLTDAMDLHWKDIMAIKQIDEDTILIRKFDPSDPSMKNERKVIR